MPATVIPASVGTVHGAVMTGWIRIRARIRPWRSTLPGTEGQAGCGAGVHSAPGRLTDGGSELPLPGSLLAVSHVAGEYGTAALRSREPAGSGLAVFWCTGWLVAVFARMFLNPWRTGPGEPALCCWAFQAHDGHSSETVPRG